MNNGFKACHKLGIALLNGAKTTTKSGPTEVLGGFLPNSSPLFDDFKLLLGRPTVMQRAFISDIF